MPKSSAAGDRRARPARRGDRPRRGRSLLGEPVVRVGPVPERARLGHRPRGLLRRAATPGTRSRTTTPAPAPTAGTRTGWPASRDIRHELCLALALWNGKDPILKERMFGLTGPQGNHGEDVKEYWWYLEGLPSHALLHWRYHYPQVAFPYDELVHHGRGLHDPELELLDTGAFDDDRYWSVDVTYAKASPTEILMRIGSRTTGRRRRRSTCCRRSGSATRGRGATMRARPRIERDGSALVGRRPRARRLPARGIARPRRRAARGALLRERDERAARLRVGGDHAVSEGRHQRPRRLGRGDGQPGGLRHQGSASVPGDRACRRQGRAAAAAPPPRRRQRRRTPTWAGSAFDEVVAAREADADEFYARARAGRHDAEKMRGAAPGVCRARLEQADLPVQRAPLARRRPRRAAAAGGSPARPQQRLAAPRLVRRARDAGPVGVPVVRRLGSRLPRGPLGASRSRVREVPAHRAAARVVPASERRAAGLRVELRRRQPAGARDGGDPRLPIDGARTASSSSGCSRSC